MFISRHGKELALASILLILCWSCDQRKNPFTNKNSAPVITSFSFRPDPSLFGIRGDSLKYRAGADHRLHLKYNDLEFQGSDKRKLQASFRFAEGSGTISHARFQPTGDALTFSVPGDFDDNLLFIPETSGRVRVLISLSDGLKTSLDSTGQVIFFENMAPLSSFSYRPLSHSSPYRFEFDPSQSVDRDGEINRLRWDFGDGTSRKIVLNTAKIFHEYKVAGQFKVQLVVWDNEGRADSTEKTINISRQAAASGEHIMPLDSRAQISINDAVAVDSDHKRLVGSGSIFYAESGLTPQAVRSERRLTSNFRMRPTSRQSANTPGVHQWIRSDSTRSIDPGFLSIVHKSNISRQDVARPVQVDRSGAIAGRERMIGAK